MVECPRLGYHVNSLKTHLLTKDGHQSKAATFWGETGVNISSEGKPHLGAVLGTSTFTELHVRGKVEKWCGELSHLSTIAESHPQAAYACFTHGLVSKWNYLTRSTKDISHLLQPLEDIIRTKFIPVLTGRPASNDDLEYLASRKVTSPVVNAILTHDDRYTYDTLADQLSSVAEVKKMKRDHQSSSSSQLKASLPPDLQRAMDLSMEKDTSNWLTVLPVDEFGFTLHKGAFRDALALRYGWSLHHIPHTCPCDTTFSVEHALSCAKGGYPSIRHNDIRDFTAHLLTEV